MIAWYTTTSAYHHKSCEFQLRSWRGARDTTLRDIVCQRLETGRWFSPGTQVSSINKTHHDDIPVAEILLKVALSTINRTNHQPIANNNNNLHYSYNTEITTPEGNGVKFQWIVVKSTTEKHKWHPWSFLYIHINHLCVSTVAMLFIDA